MIKLYGIANCDTIKMARRWLEANGIDYAFHDYRKAGVPADKLRQWIDNVGWETLLNRRGTSWRKLDPAVRDAIDRPSSIELMLQQPSIIKRPVLESPHGLLVGFDEQAWARLLR